MPWLISQFPELNHLDAGQRRRTLKLIPWWTYPYLAAASLLFASLFAASVVGAAYAILHFDAEIGLPIFLVLAASVGTYFYALRLLGRRRSIRREVAVAFRGQRAPFCFDCDYDLRGPALDQCPECGRRLGIIQ